MPSALARSAKCGRNHHQTRLINQRVIAHTGALPEDLAAVLQSVRAPIGEAIAGLDPAQLDGLRVYLVAATATFTQAARSIRAT